MRGPLGLGIAVVMLLVVTGGCDTGQAPPPSIDAPQAAVPVIELPPPSTMPFPGASWTFQGTSVGPTYISLIAVPEQCGIPDALTLTTGRPIGQEMHTSDDAMQFIRDPKHRLADRSVVSFESSVDLPSDAHFTGLRYGDDLEVWVSERLLSQALFVVRDDVVERWPRVSEFVACA